MISIVGTISLSLIPFFIFVDIWSYENATRPDIIARGPFLAGIFIIPSVIISAILWGIINYIFFKSIIKVIHIILSVFVCIVLSGLLIISGLVFIPARLLDIILPFGHYVFLVLMLILSIILIKRYKNCAQQPV